MAFSRCLRFGGFVVFAVWLAACGDSEATQRKVFIEFLQTRILAKPGVRVPELTAEETAAFGPYAKHYAVIAEFNSGLDAVVSKPMQRALAAAPRSLDQLAAKRPEIVEIKAGMAAVRAALDRQLATADGARVALNQPDDLRLVYDAAYDRAVTQPAKAFTDVFPDVDDAIGAILGLAEFIDQNGDKLQIQGAMIRVADPSTQAKLQGLIDAMRAKQQGVQKSQQRLRSTAFGN